MENSKHKKNTLMWNIMEEHKMLRELSPGHPLLKYCHPWEKDGMLEWFEQHFEEFDNEFGPRTKIKKTNGYNKVINLLNSKKDKKNGYVTIRDVKTNYYNALRDATNKLNGIEENISHY